MFCNNGYAHFKLKNIEYRLQVWNLRNIKHIQVNIIYTLSHTICSTDFMHGVCIIYNYITL